VSFDDYFFSKETKREMSALTGAPPQDAGYSNLAVTDSIACRKIFGQTVEAVQMMVTDLTTVQDLVVTGNCEIDGTVAFGGATMFHEIATFNEGISLPTSVTSIAILPASVTGSITLTTWGNIHTLDIDLTNGTGFALVLGTTLGALPSGPSSLIDVIGDDGGAATLTSLIRINTDGTIVYQGVVSGAWADATTRFAHTMWITAA